MYRTTTSELIPGPPLVITRTDVKTWDTLIVVVTE
ncbi:unnamed protein product, partial [marine sediment metagenome]